MLYEYLQGDASRWKPYFDILPTTFDTPIFWTEVELQELKGTCLTLEKIGKKESDDMLRNRIIPVVLENASVFYAEGAPQLSKEELLTLAHRIGSTIMAYAFDLDNKEEQSDDEEDGWVEDHDGQTMLGMVPMADVLNANADFNVSLRFVIFYAIFLTDVGARQPRRKPRGARAPIRRQARNRDPQLLRTLAFFGTPS
jgi:SET domain-containing protein 6